MQKRKMFRLFFLIVILALVIILTACGVDSIDLSGTWSGIHSGQDAGGESYTEMLIWEIGQTGNQILGTEKGISDEYIGHGTISGIVDGSVLTFSIYGIYDEPYDGCEYKISGEAEITNLSISGTYDGTASCDDGSKYSSNGTITLNKE